MSTKTIAWAVGLLLLAGLAFAVMTPAKGKSIDIDNGEFAQLQSDGAAVVDVRTPAEYAAGHIPGAVNVPIDTLPQQSKSWAKKAPVVLYCATGARSANAASFLAAQGFAKVYNLKRGIVAWNGTVTTGGGTSAAGGLPTVKTNGKPLFIDFASSS